MYETNINNFNIDISNVVIYLRKSRKDLEYGKDESIEKTLQRHETILQKLAVNLFGKKVPEEKIFREVVSGDTIADRPVIQKVLKLVETPNIKGILCIEVERLARGNTIDQGIILQTFQYTDTKIITPQKIFDLDNDFDRSFFEDGLHQARKYLEYTKKILNRGRISSVNEGKFVGSICPYGYDKVKLKGEKGYKLIPNDEEEKIIKLIFQKASEGVGSQNIANYLNKLGVKPKKSLEWSYSTIRDIIRNPVYYGMIRWNHRRTEKKMINGIICKSRPNHNDYILVNGLHVPLIEKELFDLANKNITTGISVRKDKEVCNPLMGLVKCAVCGRTMQRRNYRSGHIDGLICPRPHCQNVGSHLYLVEENIIEALKEILNEYNYIIENHEDDKIINNSLNNDTIQIIDSELLKLEKQLDKAYDLLEQEIYDNNTFLERSKNLKEQIAKLKKEKEKYSNSSKPSKIERIKNTIPNIKNVLNNYNEKLAPKDKNNLLKSIINEIEYLKYKKGQGHEDEFSLKINIKL